ncbi:MAG: hypothetical protein U5K69_02650 [Balneolaceae bacterium]|nr:hypothetical protein [Balneolaceae bacterium]
MVPEEDSLEEVNALMEEILENGPLAIEKALKAVYHSGEKDGYQVESELFGELCETEDAKRHHLLPLEKDTRRFLKENDFLVFCNEFNFTNGS